MLNMYKVMRPAAKSRLARAREAGSSLLEVLGAVAIGAGVLAGVADQTDRYLDNTRAIKAAEYHRAFSEAALKYVRYLDAQQPAQPAPVVELTTIQVAVPEAVSLQPDNPYRERTCLLVKSGPDPLNPTKKKFTGLVIASGESSTGKPEIIQRRAVMASLAGLAVGVRNGATLHGSSWQLPNGANDWQLAAQGCNNGANKVPEGGVVTDLQLLAVLNEMPSQVIDEEKFLHRKAVPGKPWLNAMEATLTMSSTVAGGANVDLKDNNDLKNVRNIDGVKTIQNVTTIDGGNKTNIVSINNIQKVAKLDNVTLINNVDAMTNINSIAFNRDRAITNLATINEGGPTVTIGGKTTISNAGNVSASGTVSGGFLEATNERVAGQGCSNPGAVAVDKATGAPVFCNRDKQWSFYAGFELREVEVEGVPRGQPAFAKCDRDGEILIGGGGHCKGYFSSDGNGLFHYVHFSQPGGNTWAVDCFDKRVGLTGQPPGGDATAIARAICLKPGNNSFRKTN